MTPKFWGKTEKSVLSIAVQYGIIIGADIDIFSRNFDLHRIQKEPKKSRKVQQFVPFILNSLLVLHQSFITNNVKYFRRGN